MAAATVLRSRRRLAAAPAPVGTGAKVAAPPALTADPNCWVALLLGLASLEAVAATFRVVSLYQPRYATQDTLLYPLQARLLLGWAGRAWLAVCVCVCGTCRKHVGRALWAGRAANPPPSTPSPRSHRPAPLT